MSTPDWSEDPDLAAAVAEVEDFAAAAGWDAAPQLFALVRTDELASAEPSLAAGLGGSALTPIAQDALPDRDLERALGQIAWPPAVTGCVLVQEIVVLPPSAQDLLSDDPTTAAIQAARHPQRTEARLVAGVLRDGSRACLLRIREDGQDNGHGEQGPLPVLRGAHLAPNLLDSLALTLE
jgi:hypothetical protein